MAKSLTKARTNRTVAGIVAVVVAKALVTKYGSFLPAGVADDLAPALADEVVGAVVTGLGALAVYFRQQANRPPKDLQDIITPRP